MNRRQKIIISVTGIFIVLLVLLGLTYAYFLTRITGNSNPTSISVTTANLELVYGDGTTSILTSPTPIEPGKFTSSKDFTVTNNGNALTDYAVTLEDFSITYAADTVINGQSVKAGTVTKMEYPDDMKMTVTCTVESDTDRDGSSCGIKEGILPTHNDILTINSVEVGDTHKYVLTLTYVDSGIDQSKDMNKIIRGKIDIIDPKSTIDLTGSVATYQAGDYAEINSTPVKSEIVDGKYKIIGVEPGSHTLHIKYKDANGDVQTRGSQSLTIKKGEEATISGNTITFTDESREATVDIEDNYDININETIKGYNPYKEGTLAYNIINNSMIKKNGTEFASIPLTTPGHGNGGIIYNSYSEPTKFYNTSSVSTKWYVYGSEITINKDGWYKIINPQIGQYSDVYLDMIGKYTSTIGYSTEEEAEKVMNNEFGTMSIVTASTTASKLYYGTLIKSSIEEERILSITSDDYGISYYYRGNVQDNYVTFANMCWRIVRIAGDGSIKLILEDQDQPCGENINGNWAIPTTTADGTVYKGYYGYSDYTNDPKTSSSLLMIKAFYDFQKNILTGYENNLKSGDWCLNDNVYTSEVVNLKETDPLTQTQINSLYSQGKRMYYDSYVRFPKEPTLKCNGTKISKFKAAEGVSTVVPMYVSTITADEVIYAGGRNAANENYYLINEEFKKAINGANQNGYFWLLSPGSFDKNNVSGYNVRSDGYLSSVNSGNSYGFRPAVSLAPNIVIANGEGTLSNPYTIG